MQDKVQDNRILVRGDRVVPVEVWDRTCGYYQSTSNYNKGKAEEQRMRKRYNISNLKIEPSPVYAEGI